VDDVSETDPSALCLLSPSVAGTATLEVTGYGGGVGEYTLLVSALQPSAWIDVNSGEEPAAAHAVYREEEGPTIIGVRAEPGQLVVIDARSTEFDTLLTAVTVDGTIRVNDDAPRGRTNDSRVAINAPESGEIFTLTRSFLPNLEGAFTMSVGGQEERVIPQFTLRDTEGVEFSFSDSAGKIRIVDMWATWCGPCLVEIPHFNEIAEEYADRGVAVMGISTEEPQVVRAFTEENVVRYPLLIDTDGSVSAQLELIAQEEPSQVIPTTFVVDGEGRVAAVFRGYREKEVFVREIERLLESSGQSPGGDGG